MESAGAAPASPAVARTASTGSGGGNTTSALRGELRELQTARRSIESRLGRRPTGVPQTMMTTNKRAAPTSQTVYVSRSRFALENADGRSHVAVGAAAVASGVVQSPAKRRPVLSRVSSAVVVAASDDTDGALAADDAQQQQTPTQTPREHSEQATSELAAAAAQQQQQRSAERAAAAAVQAAAPVQQRNRKMFGMLLGTLSKFQSEVERDTDTLRARQLRELEVEERERAAAHERREKARTRFQEARDARALLVRKITHKRQVLDQESLRVAFKRHADLIAGEGNVARTRTHPRLLFVPAKHTDETRALAAEWAAECAQNGEQASSFALASMLQWTDADEAALSALSEVVSEALNGADGNGAVSAAAASATSTSGQQASASAADGVAATAAGAGAATTAAAEDDEGELDLNADFDDA